MVMTTLVRRRRNAASTADAQVRHVGPFTRDLTRLTSVTVPAGAPASDRPAPVHVGRSTMVSPNEHPTSHLAGRWLNESRPIMLQSAYCGTTTGQGALSEVTHLLRSSTVCCAGERFTISSARTSGRVTLIWIAGFPMTVFDRTVFFPTVAP